MEGVTASVIYLTIIVILILHTQSNAINIKHLIKVKRNKPIDFCNKLLTIIV